MLRVRTICALYPTVLVLAHMLFIFSATAFILLICITQLDCVMLLLYVTLRAHWRVHTRGYDNESLKVN